MSALTVRDFLWLLLVTWVALAWQLHAQVRNLEISDHHDTAALFREDNAKLERINARYSARIRHLEKQINLPEAAGYLPGTGTRWAY